MISNTPLYTALCALADKNYARFHMPGHKGLPIPGEFFADTARIDFTELDETGNLYLADGPVAEAESLMAEAFGAESCLFLTGGSTQGIMTALGTFCREGDGVIVDRNCHRAVFNALALLGLEPVYVMPEYDGFFGIPSGIIAGEMSCAAEQGTRISAAIVTSPTYHGLNLDIPALADVLRIKGIPLIVDAAHGAHLPFIGQKSAVQKGADAEICSGHKTLPVLGQGAWLLFKDKTIGQSAREMAAVFGTSSPSYAIMASIDIARAYMQGEGSTRAKAVSHACEKIRAEISGIFVPLVSDGADPLRLTVNTAAGGLCGHDAAKIIKQSHGVVCEMSDRRNIVFILSPSDTEESLNRLASALEALPQGTGGLSDESPAPPPPEIVMSPRRAFFASKRDMPFGKCEGQICGKIVAPYPPGVPVIAPGEKFTKKHIAYLTKIGYNELSNMCVLL